MNFEKIVYNHKDEIVKTFQELLQIPSVLDESDASVGAPFGNNIRKALEYMLAKGKEDGFEVLNDEGYVQLLPSGTTSKWQRIPTDSFWFPHL